MGDRRNIKLVYGKGHSPVYLYTHWRGSELENILADALDGKGARGRWDDPDYLARIIFSAMVKDEIDSDAGYGIAPYRMDHNHDDIVVNLVKQTVDEQPYDSFIKEYLGETVK